MSRVRLDIVPAVKALSQLRRSGPLDVRRIGVDGLLLGPQRDRLVDVAFDGRRIWSFWLVRDGADPGFMADARSRDVPVIGSLDELLGRLGR